jgi:hypothetical protein
MSFAFDKRHDRLIWLKESDHSQTSQSQFVLVLGFSGSRVRPSASAPELGGGVCKVLLKFKFNLINKVSV